jgi:hypothetical protein
MLESWSSSRCPRHTVRACTRLFWPDLPIKWGMPSGEAAQEILYGREQQVLELLGAQAPVTVVSGDTGVGKTRVLETVAARFGGVAPAPVMVGYAPAALQASLLEALGAAAALIADDAGAARRVGRLLVEGGRRLASAKGSEIGLAVARIVLGAVRDRVGKNVTDVIIEYFDQVRDAAADDVVSRIRQAGDPDVILAIAGLAADVSAAAGGSRILLTLDNVDHLQPDDRGRLMDLGPLLPEKVSVLCTFTSVSSTDESTLDQYILAGIPVYPLLGLEAWAVEQWLSAEGLPADMSERVLRATNGYGFAVANAVQLLKSNQSLTDATNQNGREAVLRAATRQALRGLDAGCRTAALKLSVLSLPLPAQRAAAYLGRDLAAWADAEGLLVDSHIFVPGNPPWFHDQRRRLLREQIPSSSLPGYLQAAGAELRAVVGAGPGVSAEALTQYAEISDMLVGMGVADPSIAAVAQLSDNALAVLGAIIELVDGDRPGLDGEQVLLYARNIFRCSGDPSAALAELRESKLAVTASNEYRTFIAPSIGSDDVLLYAGGKIGSRLGRIPFPRIASLLFNGRLRGALGPFGTALYGIGDLSLGQLSKDSVRPHARPAQAQPLLARRNQPHLLIQGLFGDAPFYAAVAYNNPSERDSALTELTALPAGPLLGRPVALTTIAAQPDVSLPSRRLACAFERALGFSVGNIINSFDSHIQGEKISRQAAVEQQLRAINLLLELSNASERRVTGHNASQYGLLRWVGPDGWGELTAVVANAEGIIEVKDVPAGVATRFDRVALGQLARLKPGQHIGHMEYRAGRQSTVTDLQLAVNEVTQHARKIVAYNEQQQRRQLPADAGHLQALIQEQFDEREAMAQRIVDCFSRALPVGRDIYLLVDPHIRETGMIPWAGQDATIIATQMRGASPRVLVAIEPLEELSSDQGWEDRLAARVEKVFGVPGVAAATLGWSSALDAVAGLLGHMFNDILLT